MRKLAGDVVKADHVPFLFGGTCSQMSSEKWGFAFAETGLPSEERGCLRRNGVAFGGTGFVGVGLLVFQPVIAESAGTNG